MKSDKKIILAIFVILFLIVIFLNYLYQLSQTETSPIQEFSKEEKVKQVEEFKKAILKQNNNSAKVTKKEPETEQEKGVTGYEAFFKEIEDSYQNREIIPYTEPLPPKPSKRESKARLYGVDVNGNGVRDDIEREIVKDFGDDRDMVEGLFAAVRVQNNRLYAVDNNFHLSIRTWDEDFNPENRKIMENAFINYGKRIYCFANLIKSNPTYANKESWIEDKEEKYLFKMYIDSKKKDEYMKTFLKSVGGFAGDFGDWQETHPNCLEFFESTKNFIPIN